jgi:hypothetical protein
MYYDIIGERVSRARYRDLLAAVKMLVIAGTSTLAGVVVAVTLLAVPVFAEDLNLPRQKLELVAPPLVPDLAGWRRPAIVVCSPPNSVWVAHHRATNYAQSVRQIFNGRLFVRGNNAVRCLQQVLMQL